MRILLSEQADKFLRRSKISDELIKAWINKFIEFAEGEKVNIDVRKMKGK